MLMNLSNSGTNEKGTAHVGVVSGNMSLQITNSGSLGVLSKNSVITHKMVKFGLIWFGSGFKLIDQGLQPRHYQTKSSQTKPVKMCMRVCVRLCVHDIMLKSKERTSKKGPKERA